LDVRDAVVDLDRVSILDDDLGDEELEQRLSLGIRPGVHHPLELIDQLREGVAIEGRDLQLGEAAIDVGLR